MPTFDMLGIVLRSHRAPFDLSIDPQSCLIWWLTRHRELSLLLFQSQPRKREGEVTNGKCSYCTSLLASTVGFHGWTGEDGKRIRCKISMSQLSLPNFWRKSWFTTEFEPFVPSSIISRLQISWLSWAPQGINQLAGKNVRNPKGEIFPMHQCFLQIIPWNVTSDESRGEGARKASHGQRDLYYGAQTYFLSCPVGFNFQSTQIEEKIWSSTI